MPMVRFHATPDRASWKHSPGGRVEKTYRDGRVVKVMADPQIVADGELVEMDDFQASWVVGMHPQNFSIEQD